MHYPAKIVATGQFTKAQIHIHQEDFPPLPDSIAALAAAQWARQLEHNPNLKAGPMLAAQHLEQREDGLHLHCGPSRYDLFMGTTCSPEVPDKYRHRAIGALCVLLTSDQYLVFGIRSPKIDWGTLRHVVPACRMNLTDEHPYTAIVREANEELGLRPDELIDLTCAGVVSDLTWGRLNYEFVFRAKTKLTARQLVERAQTAKSADEHCQLETHLYTRPYQEHGEFLMCDPNGWVPTGWLGTILSLGMCCVEFTPTPRTYEEHMGRRLAMLRR